MANINADEAFKFDLYETLIDPEQVAPEEKKTVKLREYKKEDAEDFAEYAAKNFIKHNRLIEKIVAIAIVFVALWALVFTHTQKNLIAMDTDTAITDLEEARSENNRLHAKLSQKVPLNEVEQYAVEKLNMVKASRSQIKYINMSKVAESFKNGKMNN